MQIEILMEMYLKQDKLESKAREICCWRINSEFKDHL